MRFLVTHAHTHTHTHTHTQDKEVFMDTLNTPTIRKKLRKLSAQDPAESRKRWQHVTTALTSKDVDAATDAKHAVSQSESNACHLCGLLCMK